MPEFLAGIPDDHGSLWLRDYKKPARRRPSQDTAKKGYSHYPANVVPSLHTNFYESWGFSKDPEFALSASKSHKTVFDRLTDPMFYTGAHRERFDEFGNGRGLAGREYLYAHDGMTESPSRSHEVYSSVVRRPRKAVVTPGTLGVQRFGIQTAPPRLLWVFRNGDKHYDGAPFFVKSHIKTMEALCQELTKVVTPIGGPVRRLFDQNLKLIVDLGDLVDGGKYLCTSGEPPASFDRLEKFLSEWIIQKPHTRVRSEFFAV